MSTKCIFQRGEVVEILPYEQVKDHYGIHKKNWDKLVRENPWTITGVHGAGCIYFEGTRYWVKSPALVIHTPCVVPVEDLL